MQIPEPRTGEQVDRGSRLDQVTALPLAGFDSDVNVVAFLLGFVLFIGVCGFLDSRLSWPPRPTRERE